MRKGAYFGEQVNITRVFGQQRGEQIAQRVDLFPHVVTSANFDVLAPQLQDIEVIFSTWGMPALSAAQLDRLPHLEAVFYAAGSVQGFARPLLERGIIVMSGWAANAVPVAEFTLAQILLANKGYFRNLRDCSTAAGRAATPFVGRGNFGTTVSILGAGQIGTKLIELLKPFHLNVIVFDPFLSSGRAGELGVESVSLPEAFARGQVVTNHLANLPPTRGLLNRALFESLPLNATFINTGRGATVVEADLMEVLRARPDVTALLDVTDPEPPAPDSPFYELPNVHLTSHIAGGVGDEVARMADYAIEEFDRWTCGEPMRYAVTSQMLETMA
jgi:phosphoglycerate dehydrogenase-like enzyme